MKKIRTRLIFSVLLIVTMLMMSAAPTFATYYQEVDSQDSNDGLVTSSVISQATTWLYDNYGEFYDIQNVNADIVRIFENDDVIRYTVRVSCETMLKCNSVYELPFVKGLYSTLASKSAQSNEKTAIDTFISEIDADFEEYHGLTVPVVIAIDKNDDTAPRTMYYQNSVLTTLYDIDVLALDSQEMYDAGRSAASDIVSEYTASIGRGYSLYNRTAARDYALKWSSNPSTCYDHGNSCTATPAIKSDRSKWNNTVYPYFSTFMHNDCANFISQAMSAGGLPEDGTNGTTWFRVKNVSTQSWGTPWTSVSSLKSWMTNSSRKYWDSSTYAACNAGNIVLITSSHVAMVTLNDTINHLYTAHTTDVKDQPLTNNSSYLYYTIKTT